MGTYAGSHLGPAGISRDPMGPHGKSHEIPGDATVGSRGTPQYTTMPRLDSVAPHDAPTGARGIQWELLRDSTKIFLGMFLSDRR